MEFLYGPFQGFTSILMLFLEFFINPTYPSGFVSRVPKKLGFRYPSAMCISSMACYEKKNNFFGLSLMVNNCLLSPKTVSTSWRSDD